MPRHKQLTKKDLEVLEYIKKSQVFCSPVTIREIQDATGISSTSVVNYHLQKLEDFGKIEPRAYYKARAIKVTKKTRKQNANEAVPQPAD